MTLDDMLTSRFPDGHSIEVTDGLILGAGRRPDGGTVHVLAIAAETPLGVEGALTLARRVLDITADGTPEPILVLIDSATLATAPDFPVRCLDWRTSVRQRALACRGARAPAHER